MHSSTKPNPSSYVSQIPNRDEILPQGAIAIALGMLAGFYLITSRYIAAHRPFWFDEISTILIARLNGYGTIWQALMYGVDLQQPPYYTRVRPFAQWFGPGELGARIPSVLAMVIGLLIIFDCTRSSAPFWDRSSFAASR